MSNVTGVVLLLDAIVGTLSVMSRASELLLRLEQEGRDIGADELMALTQITNAHRAAWDEAFAKLEGGS